MCNQVTQAGDIRPRDLGRRLARLWGQVLHGLADDHELKEQRVVQERVILAGRIAAGAGEMATDCRDRVLDVSQTLELVSTHSATDSASTSALMRSLSMSGVATSTGTRRIAWTSRRNAA